MLYDAKLSLSPQINPCPNNNKKVIVSNSKETLNRTYNNNLHSIHI